MMRLRNTGFFISVGEIFDTKLLKFEPYMSVADPDEFCPDPDPTFKNVQIPQPKLAPDPERNLNKFFNNLFTGKICAKI
jgi:hypothetical protein